MSYLLISGTNSVIPPRVTSSLSKLILPLMVLTTDSGCSKISFCMKVLYSPFMICWISSFRVKISLEKKNILRLNFILWNKQQMTTNLLIFPSWSLSSLWMPRMPFLTAATSSSSR